MIPNFSWFSRIENCLQQSGPQAATFISMYALRTEGFPLHQLITKLREMSAPKQCHKHYIEKSLTWARVHGGGLESLNPITQTRGKSGPHKWLRKVCTAHLPDCRRKPALRSVHGWCPNRLDLPRILLEHAHCPVCPQPQGSWGEHHLPPGW